MTRRQRYRYEMFVRVRDFGRASQDLFPASSTGGQAFGRVIAAVAAIEDHLTKRDLARRCLLEGYNRPHWRPS